MKQMFMIIAYKCPACGGDVIQIMNHPHFDEWICSDCSRIWGIEVKKPVFELGDSHVRRKNEERIS